MQVSGLTNVVAVAASGTLSLAVRSDKTLWAWGIRLNCDGTQTFINTPQQVIGLTDVVAVAAGSGHGLAVKSDGTAWAWGDNTFGQLGDSTTTCRLTPVQVSGLTNVAAVDSGSYYFSFALVRDPAESFLPQNPTVAMTVKSNTMAIDDLFTVNFSFAPGTGINPLTEAVSLRVGSFSATIPAGSFQFKPAKRNQPAQYAYTGTINGVSLTVKISLLGGNSFEFRAAGNGANLAGTVNPVTLAVMLGNDQGQATVTAQITNR
mgnify:FL=1